jgi:poly-gamma-glutamate capsule biosynthesis protein CapA/YwtB (metallophosphatase superfamily)
MRSVFARCAGGALLLTLLAANLIVLASPTSWAATPTLQRADGLDTPLLAANMCGAGDPGDVHFTLAATGDTFPHENIQAAAEAQGYDYLFDRVRPFLKAADLAYTNFDGAMLEGSPTSGYPNFNYSPRLAVALKGAGISLVSTANNHILDRGPEGLDATLNVLQQAGILQHGAVASHAGGQPRPAYLPITVARGGASVRIAFLSFSWGTNGIPDPYQQVNLLWESAEYGQQSGVRQSVLDAIVQARRESDLVVVAAHWGYEYQFYPDAAQVEGARRMAAAGADIILGAQPHTLQPVDILDSGGRKTLVIYSLANFLASQGAFQADTFSATAAIFYVGFVRHADGAVRVTGYRYLPTIHVDDDTRPAPIPADGPSDVIEHVRREMRDFGGARQIAADPAALGEGVEVCPAYPLPGAPGARVGGDFAQHFATLGGDAPRPIAESLAVLGVPLGPVVRELGSDCRGAIDVLYTERQRLELHPDANWPFRVVGTQLGVETYKRKHPSSAIQRRTSLAGDAIGDERFQRFFEAYGGLAVFGYPISDLLSEVDEATGQTRMVQYFERARFELAPSVPPDAPLLEQVRLGALGREYPGIAVQCGLPPTAAPGSIAPARSQAIRAGPLAAPVRAETAASGRWWIWAALVLLGLAVAGAAVWDTRRRRLMWEQRRERRRRFTLPDDLAAPPSPAPAWPAQDDEELLRRLLEG